ncbi:MAG TPA: N-methyl-L-tryptophan oxidase [Caulobacteraceae bacterium]|nr:N-methyl-L-tryptophan oxidase [Caulobacteraceae bacterium]
MRTCDVAVIGLGLMGSAALYALARRGADVLGFDPLPVGSDRGSSHGSCRVFRRFNAESAAYTALSDQAFAGWRALEAASGHTILLPSQVLEAGPPGCATVSASRAAALAAGAAPVGPRTGAEANTVYPAFQLPDDWDVVVQESGGVLLAEAAMRAFRNGAGDRIVAQAARLQATSAGLRITAGDEQVLAAQAIVAAGPWIGDFFPALAPLLTVTRQTVGWFAPAKPATVGYGDFPVFLLDGPHGFIYGFPDFEGRGVKAARHDHGPRATPDAWGPPATDQELAPVRDTLAAFIPGAAGTILERDVCLYTNTAPADVRPDAGEEFIVDRLPQDPRIIVASPCSGHGAKFASAIGEMLGSLALDPAFSADPAFRLDRFSAFSTKLHGAA